MIRDIHWTRTGRTTRRQNNNVWNNEGNVTKGRQHFGKGLMMKGVLVLDIDSLSLRGHDREMGED